MSKDTTKSYNIFTIFLFLVVVGPNKFFYLFIMVSWHFTYCENVMTFCCYYKREILFIWLACALGKGGVRNLPKGMGGKCMEMNDNYVWIN